MCSWALITPIYHSCRHYRKREVCNPVFQSYLSQRRYLWIERRCYFCKEAQAFEGCCYLSSRSWRLDLWDFRRQSEFQEPISSCRIDASLHLSRRWPSLCHLKHHLTACSQTRRWRSASLQVVTGLCSLRALICRCFTFFLHLLSLRQLQWLLQGLVIAGQHLASKLLRWCPPTLRSLTVRS